MSASPDGPQRDPESAALLRTHIQAPPLRAGFREALEVRLQAADAACRRAASPAAAKRRRRFARRRFLVAAVAAVVAAAVIAMAVLPALRGTEAATAADVLASMNSAAAGTQTVRLHLESGYSKGSASVPATGTVAPLGARVTGLTTADVTLSTNGDLYASQMTWVPKGSSSLKFVRQVLGYDERRRESRSDLHADGIVVTHPDWMPKSSEVVYTRYQAAASSVRALLAEADAATPVSEGTYLGRPAWKAVLDADGLGGGMSVTVDKATGLLMQVLYRGTRQGEAIEFVPLRVTRFEVDPQLSPRWRIVPLLKKTTPTLRWNYFFDDGVRFGTPQAVAARSWPTLPLIPQWEPAGYRLTDVANAVYEDMRPGHENDNSWHWSVVNDPPRGRRPGTGISKRLALRRCKQGVLVRFRRGFGTFVVEISPRLPDEPGMGKLTQEGRLTAEDLTLSGGYLKGARARTWISSASFPFGHLSGDSMSTSSDGPTLLTYSDRSMITIYGDLTRQELIAVANSLKVYGDVERPLPAGYGD